jgi:hypothetical protein
VSVIQAAIMSIMTFGSLAPLMPQILRALVSSKEVIDLISRKPEIDYNNEASATIEL